MEKELKTLLREHGKQLKKAYGQNFLTDPALLDEIVQKAGVTEKEVVLEIGCGAGALTRALCKRAKRVLGYEIDRELKPILNETLSEFDNVEIVFNDVMKCALSDIEEKLGGEYIMPNFNPLKLIDAHFQIAAKKAGKSVIGLETVDFQIETLYKGATIERQKQQLLCMVDNDEYYALQMKELSAAYFAQDMQALLEIAEEKLENQCDATPEEKEQLIYGRNASWVEKMPTAMGEASTLFVVGALHLPGENGVLEMLKSKGYTIEVVK